jgi:Flp pilus assembly protein TadD
LENELTAHDPIASGNGIADALVHQGLAASAAQDSASAIDLFSKACAAAPDAGITHFLLASELAHAGRWDAAESAFANAVLVAPDLAVARYQLGLLQFTSARAALALVTWQPLTLLPESSPFPHFVQGFAALAHDDFGAALTHFEAGLRCPIDNEALRSDVIMLVERVRAAQAVATLSPAADGAERDVSAEPVHDHFLLSNYTHRGRVH